MLKIPGLAPVARAFALHRFSMAAHMTIEAGLKADRVLKSSLRATANKAYQKEGERAAKLARKGNEIVETLGKLGPTLFPDEFIQAVHVGEESGRLAEVMEKEAKVYQEASIRGMKFLVKVVTGFVYFCIAVLIIVCIFRIIGVYTGRWTRRSTSRTTPTSGSAAAGGDGSRNRATSSYIGDVEWPCRMIRSSIVSAARRSRSYD